MNGMSFWDITSVDDELLSAAATVPITTKTDNIIKKLINILFFIILITSVNSYEFCWLIIIKLFYINHFECKWLLTLFLNFTPIYALAFKNTYILLRIGKDWPLSYG